MDCYFFEEAVLKTFFTSFLSNLTRSPLFSFFFFLMMRPPPNSPLFPYPPLFRSVQAARRWQELQDRFGQTTHARERGPSVVVALLLGRAEHHLAIDTRHQVALARPQHLPRDRKSTRLNSSHLVISYAVFCLKKKQ